MEENTMVSEIKPSKEKKGFKGILISLGLIVGFGIILRFLATLLVKQFTNTYISETLMRIVLLLLFLVPLFSEILIVYFVLLLMTRKTGGDNKLKKRLKITLFVVLLVLLPSALAFFTKIGAIPNRLNFGILETEKKGIIYEPVYYGACDNPNMCFDKPIIYLYPTVETEIHVELGDFENLLHTYPKYNSGKGRNVIAQPNGDLEDIETGRKLYALYWEGRSDNKTKFDEGFVVAGKDIIPFLEEKLAILGLNEREAEEFIVYWLPQMESNKWNLIRFETIEEQNKNMPLSITPTPDTIIRVMMDWKAIDRPIDILEQQLETPERNGFVVVEWGGSHRD